MPSDFLDSFMSAITAELHELRTENHRLHAIITAADKVMARGDGAAAARLEQGESIVRDLLAHMPAKEFAKDDRQQAVWRAKAWLVEVQK